MESWHWTVRVEAYRGGSAPVPSRAFDVSTPSLHGTTIDEPDASRDGWRVAWNAARWKSWFVEDRGVRKAKAQGGTIHDARSGVMGVSPACGRRCVLWFVWDEVEEETGVGRAAGARGQSQQSAETGARVAVSLDYFMCGGRECVCYCFLSSLISLSWLYISSRNARAIRIPGRSFPLDVPP